MLCALDHLESKKRKNPLNKKNLFYIFYCVRTAPFICCAMHPKRNVKEVLHAGKARCRRDFFDVTHCKNKSNLLKHGCAEQFLKPSKTQILLACGILLATFWLPLGCPLAACWLCFVCVLAAFLAAFSLPFRCLLVAFWLPSWLPFY